MEISENLIFDDSVSDIRRSFPNLEFTRIIPGSDWPSFSAEGTQTFFDQITFVLVLMGKWLP